MGGLFYVLFRALFGLIDGLIYWVDAELYGLLLKIASAEVFTNSIIETVADRIYQLLGLIMLFKLMSSFLTYIINPEDMLDKTKGLGNIIKKIIITLFLIVITPWAFDQSRLLQHYVLDGQLIEYFVFGRMQSNQEPGYEMMYTVGKMFITPKETSCPADWDAKNSGLSSSCSSLYGGPHMRCHLCDIFNYSGSNNECNYCAPAYDMTGTDKKEDIYDLMELPVHAIGDWWGYDKANDKFDYIFGLSTIVGIAIAYMLIVICIDVAVRSVKLGFYEIISPIPIISYIGLKDGKDTMLNKWFQQVLKTYADLFTRVAGLQIAIFFIQTLKNGFGNTVSHYSSNGLFVNIFLIIGALTFAKQFPNILKEMGINFEGGGFNLKKKLTDDLAGSKQIYGTARRATAGALGLAGGMAANGIKGVANMWKAHKANDELRKQMFYQGYKKFGRKERNQFYQDHADMRHLGSARSRRDFAGSEQNRRARRDEAQRAHTNRHQEIEFDRMVALDGVTDAKEIAAINRKYDRRQRAEVARFKREEAEADSSRAARKEFTNAHASEFSGGFGSVIAGGVSAAARAATSKDGKIFSGAASGIKGSVDARDLRDKRQEADYGFWTRRADDIMGWAGLDTVSKAKANEMRDEINALQLQASLAQKEYQDAPPGAARDAAMARYQQLQAKITKTQKNIEKLYEASKK